MIRWFRENGVSIFWALALAVAVWIAAVTAADPDEQRAFNRPVSIEIVGQDSGLVILGEPPKDIAVTLRAPRSVWNRLEGSEKPIRAVMDLSGLGAGPHTVVVQVQVSETPALLVSAQPSTFTITLEPLATKRFPVDLSLTGQPAVGYQSGDAALTPKEVLVSGAQSLVDQVNRVRVVVNLSGTRESVNQVQEVQLLNANNQPVDGLSINPLEVQIELPVSQQGGYRDVVVKVIPHGQVANGYLLTSLSVFPPVVTVYSTDPALVNALPGVVETQPLELRGASENISTRLALTLPEGISVVGEQSVQVQVGIEPIQSSLTLARIAIEVIGLPDGMTAQVSPAEVDVILSGPAPLLDQLARQDIRVIVDVTGLAPGTYQLKPVVEILVADISAESILPNTVEVIIAPAVTPTP
jgi:YbbR domain-containing protein